MLDKAAFPRDKVCGDALSGKVVEVLNKLDTSLVPAFAQTQQQVGSWGVRFVAPNGRDLRVPFAAKPEALKQAPGFISKRVDFDAFLVERLKAEPLVSLEEGVQVQQARHMPEGILLELKDGAPIYAQLVLAADGAQSKLRRLVAGQGLPARHHSAGIRVYYEGVREMDAQNFIELHFLKPLLPGYLWVFPLPGGQANVGLGVRSDYVSRKQLNLKQLLPKIIASTPELKARFAAAEPLENAKGFGLPLGSKRWPLSTDNLLLLGDAGNLIDPFTGEGIGNALYTGLFAAEQVEVALATQEYSAKALRAYDQAVYARLWSELRLSTIMQRLLPYPWLFNLVVNKARRSPTLRETISVMFEDLDLRARLRNPMFYARLLFE